LPFLDFNLQRRDCKTNCCLVCFPFLVCLLLGAGQMALTAFYLKTVGSNGPPMDCGYCAANADPSRFIMHDALGGLDCVTRCPLPIAPKWAPVLQLPGNSELGMGGGLSESTDLQGPSNRGMRMTKSSPATFLVTGSNKSFVQSRVFSIFFSLGACTVLVSNFFFFSFF
jgi:hypothetical protein